MARAVSGGVSLSETSESHTTEFVLNAREQWLMSLMEKRPLADNESIMLYKRDRNWNIRKGFKDFVFAIPGILLSIQQLVITLVR